MKKQILLTSIITALLIPFTSTSANKKLPHQTSYQIQLIEINNNGTTNNDNNFEEINDETLVNNTEDDENEYLSEEELNNSRTSSERVAEEDRNIRERYRDLYGSDEEEWPYGEKERMEQELHMNRL